MEPNKATQTKTDTDRSRKAQGIHVVLGVEEEPVAQQGGGGWAPGTSSLLVLQMESSSFRVYNFSLDPC